MRPYTSEVYREWRAAIRKRDKYQCGLCSKKTNGGVCHHIHRWADNALLQFDVNNGIYLCRPCHKIVTGNEESYIHAFVSKIAITNGAYKDYGLDVAREMMVRANEKANQDNTEI